MEIFSKTRDPKNSEDKYTEWLENNRGGFVMTGYQPENPPRMTLHRADRKHIGAEGAKPPNGIDWTAYPKYCSTDRGELEKQAQKCNWDLKPCKLCFRKMQLSSSNKK